jgi:hypothetical protein
MPTPPIHRSAEDICKALGAPSARNVTLLDAPPIARGVTTASVAHQLDAIRRLGRFCRVRYKNAEREVEEVVTAYEFEMLRLAKERLEWDDAAAARRSTTPT